jgi:hypothetical protein
MYGKQRLLVWTLLILAAGTLLAALAGSLPVLIVGRIIQGVAGGIFPLAFAIVRDEHGARPARPDRVHPDVRDVGPVPGLLRRCRAAHPHPPAVGDLPAVCGYLGCPGVRLR